MNYGRVDQEWVRSKPKLEALVDRVLSFKGLNPGEKLTLVALVSLEEVRGHPHRPLFVDLKTLGDIGCVTHRTALRTLRSLEKAGHLKVHDPSREELREGVRSVYLSQTVLGN